MKAYFPIVILILAGLVGMFVHFAKRKVKGETVSSFVEYYVKNYPGYTAASIIATVVGVIGLVHAGIDGYHALVAAFSTGYMSDSAINKDDALKAAVNALDIAPPPEDEPAEATPVAPTPDAIPTPPVADAAPVEAAPTQAGA